MMTTMQSLEDSPDFKLLKDEKYNLKLFNRRSPALSIRVELIYIISMTAGIIIHLVLYSNIHPENTKLSTTINLYST